MSSWDGSAMCIAWELISFLQFTGKYTLLREPSYKIMR